MTTVGEAAYQKITNMLGEEQGAALIREALEAMGVSDLLTASDCLRFAGILIDKGGLVAAIGRSIKVKALMHGATE